MKPVLLFLSVFLFFSYAKSQPVITSGGLVSVGDSYNFQYTDVENVSIPAIGANQVWDYSGLVDSGTAITENFVAPSSTPYGSLFPTSTIAVDEEQNGVTLYAYYNVSGNNFQTVGFLSPGSNDTSYYQPPLIDFENPFTYNSFFSDSTNETSYTGFGSYSFPTIDSTYGVGYGSLELPGGVTYSNVLEIKQVQNIFFSTSINYIFFVQGIAAPLLEIDISSTDSSIQSVDYMVNTITPLTWLNFNVVPDGCEAQMNWQTANEQNTSYFTVQRSSDAVHFSNIENVKASDKMTGVNNYAATDAQPLDGKNYYRIQQTDQDGKYTYSTIEEITFNENSRISVVPDIVNGPSLTLATNSAKAEDDQLYIADANGKILLSEPIDIGQGYNTQLINVDRLAAGTYFIIVNNSNSKQTTRFIKE